MNIQKICSIVVLSVLFCQNARCSEDQLSIFTQNLQRIENSDVADAESQLVELYREYRNFRRISLGWGG